MEEAVRELILVDAVNVLVGAVKMLVAAVKV
jgi:hypothetical protein